MTLKPINLPEALASFNEVYSPRMVATMNDYDVRVAHTLGEHIWHVHEDTDEFFLVAGVGTAIIGRPRPLPPQRRAEH